MTIKTLGIDLAKNVFQLYGADADGGCVLQRRVRRENLLAVVGSLPPCTIGVEACTGAVVWQHRFEAFGHEGRIIAPQYVKPLLKPQKNDRRRGDLHRPAAAKHALRAQKTIEQQDIQRLHRARQRLVNHRTAPVSQMQGILPVQRMGQHSEGTAGHEPSDRRCGEQERARDLGAAAKKRGVPPGDLDARGAGRERK